MTEKRICLITGSYRGMGLETARQLATKGMHVIVTARTLKKAADSAEAIASSGGSAEALELDVTNDASVAKALAEIESKHGRLDVLINNAGINLEYAEGASPLNLTADTLKQIIDANVCGPLRMIQGATQLLSKGKDARIVNVSSTLGSLTALSDPTHPYYAFNVPGYNTSKTALNGLTVAYSKALKDLDIAVVSICPGWVKTDMGSDEAPRTVQEGVRVIIDMATQESPPTGVFVDENGTVAW